MYMVRYKSASFADYFKLDEDIQIEVDELIHRLQYFPFRYSKALMGDLTGLRKSYVHKARYRIVFYIDIEKQLIEIYSISNRGSVYQVV